MKERTTWGLAIFNYQPFPPLKKGNPTHDKVDIIYYYEY
jgi:hypothetical protein